MNGQLNLGNMRVNNPSLFNLLSKEIARGLAKQEVKDRLGPLHAKPIGSSPAELAAYTSAEIVRWGKVAKAANIRVD